MSVQQQIIELSKQLSIIEMNMHNAARSQERAAYLALSKQRQELLKQLDQLQRQLNEEFKRSKQL